MTVKEKVIEPAIHIAKVGSKVEWSLKRIIIVSLVNAAWNMMWFVYNNYVPIYLQAGNPNFDAGSTILAVGFGLGSGMTGFILSLDNIISFLLTPFIGMLSDKTHSRLGRRKPFLLYPMPFAVIGITLIPILVESIPAGLNGQSSRLLGLLIPFIGMLALILLANAIMELPANTLAYDITPSNKRSLTAGILSLGGGVATLIISFGGPALYAINPGFPFWFSAIMTLLGVMLTIFLIREPLEQRKLEDEETVVGLNNLGDVLNVIKQLDKKALRSVLYILGGLSLTYIGAAIFQAFFSSYAVSVLKIDEATAGTLNAVMALAFMIMAVPIGLIGARIGRKRSIMIGVILMILSGSAIFFFHSLIPVVIALIVLGIGYAAVNVLQTPLIIDSAPDDSAIGTFNAIGMCAVTLGYILGPTIGGWAIQGIFHTNYRFIWPLMAVFFLIRITRLYTNYHW